MGNNGRTFFDKPKATVGCSANGRRSRRRRRKRRRLIDIIFLSAVLRYVLYVSHKLISSRRFLAFL